LALPTLLTLIVNLHLHLLPRFWLLLPCCRPDATYMVQQLEQLQEELTWQHLFGMQGLAG
jgi:hypothetical protein